MEQKIPNVQVRVFENENPILCIASLEFLCFKSFVKLNSVKRHFYRHNFKYFVSMEGFKLCNMKNNLFPSSDNCYTFGPMR